MSSTSYGPGKGPIDFEGINRGLLVSAESSLQEWLPGGWLKGEEWVCGSLRGEEGGSLKVNIFTGKWADFATGEKGGDLISLYAAIFKLSQRDAAIALGGNGSVPIVSRPTPPPEPEITQPPADARLPNATASSIFYRYLDKYGDLLFLVERRQLAEKKKMFLPHCWSNNGWVNKAWPAPRPLFGLEELRARPDAAILLVEGEKACIAARAFANKHYIVMTWPNGSQAWNKADWTPIHGRKLLLWPDNDRPGVGAMYQIADILFDHCPEIKILKVDGMPEGFDAADRSWTWAEFKEWATPRAHVYDRAIHKLDMSQKPEKSDMSQGLADDFGKFLVEAKNQVIQAFKACPELVLPAHITESVPPPPESPPLPFGRLAVDEVLNKGVKEASPADTLALAQTFLDPYFRRFTSNEVSLLFEIKNESTKEVSLCLNEQVLSEHVGRICLKDFGRIISPGSIKKIIDQWKILGARLPVEPTSFTWAAEDEWTYKKISFNPSPGSYTAWAEFLVRLSSADEFMAFIWSIFEKKNTSRQFLYLYDPAGQGGKSTIIRVLGDILGNSFSSINNSMVSGGGNRWLLSNLYGKRLVVWPDCKNPKFCMSEVVRNITSGDHVPIEFKNESPFITEMYVKLIIGSNEAPEISGSGADKSRLIRIDLHENDQKDDPSWVERLKAELPHFLFACKEMYERLCPHHGNIYINQKLQDSIDDSAEAVELKFESIVERRIEIGEGLETYASDWLKMCREEELSDRDVGHLKNYLIQQFPKQVKFGRRMDNGKKKSVYWGLKIHSGLRIPNPQLPLSTGYEN